MLRIGPALGSNCLKSTQPFQDSIIASWRIARACISQLSTWRGRTLNRTQLCSNLSWVNPLKRRSQWSLYLTFQIYRDPPIAIETYRWQSITTRTIIKSLSKTITTTLTLISICPCRFRVSKARSRHLWIRLNSMKSMRIFMKCMGWTTTRPLAVTNSQQPIST